jgi:dTDP-4-dehydrorhamnose reductase
LFLTASSIVHTRRPTRPSKLYGEELLAQAGGDFCIVRVEWTYGSSGNNFVKKIVSLCRSRSEIKVVDDQIGGPTATADVAQVIAEMLKDKVTGLYHFANSGYVSRFEMARFIVDKLKLSTKVLPCKSSEFKTAAQRPLNSRFDCDKIKTVIKQDIKTWELSLSAYLESV